jgi:ankyrin repeat protein
VGARAGKGRRLAPSSLTDRSHRSPPSLPPSLPPSPPLPQALASSLSEDPSLARSRATRLAMLVPDGQTPLHSAASMNNLPALTVLLGAPETDCFAVDLHG